MVNEKQLVVLNGLILKIFKMKIKVKIVKGSWVNDDIDLIPTIKLRTGSKINEEKNLSVKVTSIALCWLKWGIMISFGYIKVQ